MSTTHYMPERIARLPRDKHDRPVPWFVATIDGVPDFRVIRPGGIADALRFELCWVCGTPRGRHAAFVIGPMCSVNRVSAEPPSHLDCATFSARACPFLTTPQMVRRDRHMPDGVEGPAGTMIRRNPGVALVWSSRTWSTFGDGQGGTLFDVGDPTAVHWFAQGRDATRDEVLASIDSGLPLLREVAEEEGAGALAELGRMHDRALALLPA